ncbi:hypothetical protein [Streptomyces sp. NPDC007172]|uniref:hypothetical protein n=1 Tax=Streptomyces sp. NPDC007172 TaxID=3364776 RepID=UPI003683BFB7
MPRPDVARSRSQRGTIMLFVAAAVLATLGALLLLGIGRGERPAASDPPPTAASSAKASQPEPSSTKSAQTSPAAKRSEPVFASEPTPMPAAIQETAKSFTTAWASHDARSGRDASFDDASRRAAAYADGDLAEDLRTHTGGSAGAQQWLAWKNRQVQVTVTILRVSLPDGAPTPAEDFGFARVIYKLTETPAQGSATESEEQVALKLRRGAGGAWRVVGVPNV